MLRQLRLPALLGASALVITIILAPRIGILPRLGFIVAAFLAAASILPLIGRNPLRAPLSNWGMVVAHFGIAVALAGMAANAAFSSETLADRQAGRYADRRPLAGAARGRHADRRARIGLRSRPSFARRAVQGVVTLNPQTRYFTDPPTETNESAIRTFWNGQLYTVLGRPDAVGRLAVAAVVEAVRDTDLGRRRADRARRGAGAARADRGVAGVGASRAGAGALRMSRAFACSRSSCCLCSSSALIWRLANAGDTTSPRRWSSEAGTAVCAAAGAAEQARPVVCRPGHRAAAAAQRLRKLVRPMHDRSQSARRIEAQRASGSTASRCETRPDALNAFLARNGDPYERIGADRQSEVQIAFGSSGVPGKLRDRWQGYHPLTVYRRDRTRRIFRAILRKLEQVR